MFDGFIRFTRAFYPDKIQPFLKLLCCYSTVIIAHSCLAFYWALQSSLSENIRYGSMDDLFAVYGYYDTIDKRECDIMHETFAFKWYFQILCQALVAQLTVHSVFSSRIDLVQCDLAILTE